MSEWSTSDRPASGPPPAGPRSRRRGWSGLRITALVIGSILALISLFFLVVGGQLTYRWANRDNGYTSLRSGNVSTPGYALASPQLQLGRRWRTSVGNLRVRATGQGATTPIFLGIGPTGDVSNYLGGVGYTTVNSLLVINNGSNVTHSGNAPSGSPATRTFWLARSSGTGTQTIVWPGKLGNWTVVAMNVNGAPGLTVHGDVAGTVPALPWAAISFVGGGVLLLIGSLALIIVPIRRATRRA